MPMGCVQCIGGTWHVDSLAPVDDCRFMTVATGRQSGGLDRASACPSRNSSNPTRSVRPRSGFDADGCEPSPGWRRWPRPCPMLLGALSLAVDRRRPFWIRRLITPRHGCHATATVAVRHADRTNLLPSARVTGGFKPAPACGSRTGSGRGTALCARFAGWRRTGLAVRIRRSRPRP